MKRLQIDEPLVYVENDYVEIWLNSRGPSYQGTREDGVGIHKIQSNRLDQP